MTLVVKEVNELLDLYEIQITGAYYDWERDFPEKFQLQKILWLNLVQSLTR